MPPESELNAAEIGKLAKALQPVVDYVNEEKAGKQQERLDADVGEIMDFFSEVKELKALPDKLKRGFLEVHAQDVPDFGKAFDNKAKNPKAWETARKAARDSLTEIASNLPGSKRRSAGSDDGVSPAQKMNMSDYEWRQYKDEQELRAEAS